MRIKNVRIKKICAVAVVSLGLLTLVACSTTGGKKAGMGAGGSGAYAMGLGSGNDLSNSYSTKAPTNQIYYFDFDSNEVHGEYLPSIDAQAKYLVEHPAARVLLTGHTDSRGSREYNIALGERRAQSVANRMMMDGVNQSQLRLVSYGSERPAALGGTEDEHAKNRRVELVYESK